MFDENYKGIEGKTASGNARIQDRRSVLNDLIQYLFIQVKNLPRICREFLKYLSSPSSPLSLRIQHASIYQPLNIPSSHRANVIDTAARYRCSPEKEDFDVNNAAARLGRGGPIG